MENIESACVYLRRKNLTFKKFGNPQTLWKLSKENQKAFCHFNELHRTRVAHKHIHSIIDKYIGKTAFIPAFFSWVTVVLPPVLVEFSRLMNVLCPH